jgi:hypothetical protein
VPFKAAELIQVANLWKPLNTKKIELYGITCANVQFRVQKQVVRLESRYITLSMNRELQYSNGSFATRKFQSVVHTCGESLGVQWATGSVAND